MAAFSKTHTKHGDKTWRAASAPSELPIPENKNLVVRFSQNGKLIGKSGWPCERFVELLRGELRIRGMLCALFRIASGDGGSHRLQAKRKSVMPV
jgi:hypothetical protein